MQTKCSKSFMHCVSSLPSTITKFLNPMASNRCLTISDNSGIYKKDKQIISVKSAFLKKGLYSLTNPQVSGVITCIEFVFACAPSPAAFGCQLQCRPAVWWTERQDSHSHCHLHPLMFGWRWRKPSWEEALWIL